MCVVVAPSGNSMQDNYAPCKYVHTRVTRYFASVVDLRWCRAIHSCDSCNFIKQLQELHPAVKNGNKTPKSTQLCSAVHYGICSPVKLSPITPPSTNGPRTSNHVIIPVSPTKNPPSEIVLVPQVPQVTKDKDAINKEKEAVFQQVKRGEPDGEANTFLRQKEAQLREKREREQRQKEKSQAEKLAKSDKEQISSKQSAPSSKPGPIIPVLAGGDAENLDSKGVKKKDGLVAAAISSLKNQNNQPLSSPKVRVVAQVVDTPTTTPTPTPTSTPAQPVSTNTTQPVISNKQPEKTEKPTSKTPSAVTSQPVKGPAPTVPPKDVSKDSNTSNKVQVPQFYFPLGQPQPSQNEDLEKTAQKIKEEFMKVEGGKITKNEMGTIAKTCGLPFYWKCPLFVYAGGEKNGHITLQSFLAAWKKLVTSCHDDASRFMRIMTPPGKTYLEENDFLPLIQDVVDTHPGLSFLQDAPEFHSRYVQTVISRIFYSVNRSWSGRVIASEVRKSNFLQTLVVLEDEEDINHVMDFFSYEHFYVIYCKFWELDKDHDLFISREDLARHNDHALSMRMIDRLYSGTVTRNLTENKMSYKDFVYFLISEEDKKHPTSIEYWFRCMDLDGDGVISMYEMEYFYEEQVEKMEALGIETLPFEDCLCQMLDMIKPLKEGHITLRDLKQCKLTPIFFDTFFNLEKYLEHEQKDPFANLRDHDGEEVELSDWERYAAEEYEILVAEEGANEEINYEDDFEPEEDGLAPAQTAADNGEIMRLSDPPQKRKSGGVSSPNEDIYDFANQDNLGY